MLPMHKKEFDKWTEVRKSGGTKYSVKTSLIATILVFWLYFIVNGYVHLADIDKYIAYNIAQADTLFVALFITFITLFVVSKIIFKINEKRYSATQNTIK